MSNAKTEFERFYQEKKGKVLISFVDHKGISTKHKAGTRPRRRAGVVVAYEMAGRCVVGVSLCNEKAGDKFDKYIGLMRAIAFARRTASRRNEQIPRTMLNAYDRMLERSKKYFKEPVPF